MTQDDGGLCNYSIAITDGMRRARNVGL